MTDALRTWRGKRKQLSVFLLPEVMEELRRQAACELMSLPAYVEFLVMERAPSEIFATSNLDPYEEDQLDILSEYSVF